jgi:hypothetical protein
MDQANAENTNPSPARGKSGKIAPDIMGSYPTEEEDLSTSPLLDMSCCRGSQTIGGGLALLSSSSSAHRSRSPASVFTSIFQFLIDVVHLNVMIFYSEPLNMFSFFKYVFIFKLLLLAFYFSINLDLNLFLLLLISISPSCD